MGLRLPTGARSGPESEPPVDESEPPPGEADTGSDTSAVRTLFLVALATVVVAYAVSRIRASDGDDGTDPLETIRRRTETDVPAAIDDRLSEVDIEIGSIGRDDLSGRDIGSGTEGVSSSDADGPRERTEPMLDDATDGTGDTTDAIDDSETTVGLADGRSPAEISERTTDEIQDEPAEPGEMTVDDDVEDLVDDAVDTGSEDDEADGTISDTDDDEANGTSSDADDDEADDAGSNVRNDETNGTASDADTDEE